MTLIDIFQHSVEKFRDRPALIMRPRYRTIRWTYAGLARYADSIARMLAAEGVRSGDRVLLWAPNSPYWVGAFFGILLRGGVVVPLHVENTSEFIEKVARQTDARLLLKASSLRGPASGLRAIDIDFLPPELASLPASPQPAAGHEDDLAEIVYTSGTTGAPKGVMLTHRNIVSNIEDLAGAIPVGPQDRFLSILPLSHLFEQVAGMLFPISRGARIIYLPRVSSGLIAEAMAEHRVTKLLAVPQFLDTVMKRIEARARAEGREAALETLRRVAGHLPFPLRRILFRKVLRRFGGRFKTVASGGAPLDPGLEQKWELLGIRLLQGYGLTETSPIVSANTYRAHRFGSVGKPLKNVSVTIVPDGEILVKGPNVFPGYYRDEAKTRQAFTADGPSTTLGAGWFKTGDLGELDRDGFLSIRGRKKYLILGPAGQNVYPEDIEFELNKIPGMKDSAVVGLERPGGRVEIHAVLLLEAGVDSAAVVARANERLASFQRIQAWSVWPGEDFPRSATRKVKKENVLEWLREKKPAAARARPAEEKTPLMRLLAEVTDVPLAEIQPATKIVPELHLDSLSRIEVVARIEEQFGVEVEEAKITPASTVQELEALVQAKQPIKEKPPLRAWPRSWFVSLDRALDQTLIILPLLKLFVSLRVQGRDHLSGLSFPVIFMPNHLSYLDSAALAMALPFRIRKRLAFAAAQDVVWGTYKRMAWLAEYFFNAFPFPRREGENIKAGLEHMGRLLDQGWSAVLYPEGEISPAAELLPLKRGAGLVAVEMGVPVVPVRISGTAEIMPSGEFLPRRRGAVTVRFGKPLRFGPRDSYIDATGAIESALRRL